MMLEGAQVGFGTGIATAPRVHFFNPPNDQCCESVGDTSNGFHGIECTTYVDFLYICRT